MARFGLDLAPGGKVYRRCVLIKDLAERAGVSVKAVRYYESRGLITPERAANGYREYDDADVLVVREIRALLSLGLTADETVPFVECLRAGNERADVCPSSLDAYRMRIAEIDQRIEELSRLRGELSGLLEDAESYTSPTSNPQETP
ncbi:MerR family transcriptional regulator [Nocardioides daeguensis]|uniref:MerR family transcriptional regulator n=1 Tax=Nocardioides daeguensis TaxID=908359 RepID=A0ABP6V316_9ACTN